MKPGRFGGGDIWGFRPQDPGKKTMAYNINATILYQLGVNHEKLTVCDNGIDHRLTDVYGHVLEDMLG